MNITFQFDNSDEFAPLASRMRPTTLEELVGQEHLLGENKPLYSACHSAKLHSMILWGPPGTGKTTLARVLASGADAEFETLSAVMAGVKEIREVVARAKMNLANGRATVLFVDEVHRFNKSQQDAFLPHVETGEITFIGATTENPSFQLNNALLSRARVYVLKPLTGENLTALLKRALSDKKRGLGGSEVQITDSLLLKLAQSADGDARQALNLLEIAAQFADKGCVDEEAVAEVLSNSWQRFDNQGDVFYDQISALHKSVRGSDPDAALYWFARMVAGGCDLNYILRRVVRMASEDIGNADPRALSLALAAGDSYDRLGSPEGELAIAQAIVYCAVAAKSNSVYTALNLAMNDAKTQGSLEVPMHLRNAPTKLLKEIGASKDYRYAHDEPGSFAAGENYFPVELSDREYYQPKAQGMEIKIKEKLDYLRTLNKKSKEKESI